MKVIQDILIPPESTFYLERAWKCFIWRHATINVWKYGNTEIQWDFRTKMKPKLKNLIENVHLWHKNVFHVNCTRKNLWDFRDRLSNIPKQTGMAVKNSSNCLLTVMKDGERDLSSVSFHFRRKFDEQIETFNSFYSRINSVWCWWKLKQVVVHVLSFSVSFKIKFQYKE